MSNSSSRQKNILQQSCTQISQTHSIRHLPSHSQRSRQRFTLLGISLSSPSWLLPIPRQLSIRINQRVEWYLFLRASPQQTVWDEERLSSHNKHRCLIRQIFPIKIHIRTTNCKFPCLRDSPQPNKNRRTSSDSRHAQPQITQTNKLVLQRYPWWFCRSISPLNRSRLINLRFLRT